MIEPAITFQIALVLITIMVAVLLFITEIIRIDVVAIMMMVFLPLSGLVTPHEAFSGFSSNAVVSIIAVMIIGAGLDRTGVMNRISAPIIRMGGGKRNRVMALICGSVAIISGFMQNIGAAALFLPTTIRVCKKSNIAVNTLLMPMGFCAILGGTITLVGSSPLILLNDLMAQSGLAPFGLFSVTPIGITLIAGGIIYCILFSGFIFPERNDSGTSVHEQGGMELLDTYGISSRVYEVIYSGGSDKSGRSVGSFNFRKSYHCTLVGIAPEGGEKNLSPTDSHRIHPGDSLALVGPVDQMKKLLNDNSFFTRDRLTAFADIFSEESAGMNEAVVLPRSSLEGQTIHSAQQLTENRINVLALLRDNEVIKSGFTSIQLKPGDALLMFARWIDFNHFKDSKDLIVPAPDKEIFSTEKANKAIFSFALAISLVLFKDLLGLHINLAVSLMTGALAMVLFGVMKIDEAYASVNWNTVFLLAGLIPLGVAMEKSGTTIYIAHTVLNLFGEITPLLLLIIVVVLSSVFSLLVSNVGATVLLVPLAIGLAQEIGADPRTAALAVAIGVSNSFLLPTHQVHALLMGPGQYKTIDYLRAGSGMSFLFVVILVFMLSVFYGI